MINILKSYYRTLIAHPVKVLGWKLRLWHLETTLGPHVDESEEAWELNEIITIELTKKWTNRAWKYHLELPPRDNDDYWFRCRYEDERALKRKGIRFILDQYRKEKSAQRDAFIKWGTFLLAGIAAFGTILKIIG